MNFTPLKYNDNSSLNKFTTDYISMTSPNKDQTQLNNFNHFSALSDMSSLKENNNNNFNSSNFISPTKNIILDKKDLNTNNELINSFKNTNINNTNNVNENNNENNLIQELKKQYDERIISLYNNVKTVISKLENDDILASMRDDIDCNNSPFVNNRIKEIIDENFYSEKEKMIEKLSFENANLKNKINNLNIILNNKNINNNNNVGGGKKLSLNQQIQIKI